MLEIAIQHRDDENSRKAAQVNNDALELVIRNMVTEGYSRAGEDARDVLHFCYELLELKSNSPKEQFKVLTIKVCALLRASSNQRFNDLHKITFERTKLSIIYVLELKKRKRGDQMYADVHSGIRAFRKEVTGHFETGAQARWEKCLEEIRARVQRNLPRKREIRQKWNLLYLRLLARKRWTTILRRIRRRAAREA
ncbi:hypothetical protein LX32DRAFT_649969 [Colletotrichum zoysiae]|uniref:Uncharacterized protein n=1 Tax=Colletotrichum zoysiae TaxID=1216348 RepID=A0AAD9HNZ9_9PEZI|nr:hypothetical protein LX32DRAFT_649969 [Colletotrichum zoysiae]